LLTASWAAVQTEPSGGAATDEDFGRRSGINMVAGRAGLKHVQCLFDHHEPRSDPRVVSRRQRYVGNLAPMPGVFPDYPAPAIRNTDSGREMTMMRWGMPPPPRTGGPPVTNIRNTSSPLAHVAQAGEPLFGPCQQLRRICTRAEPGNQEKGCGLVRPQRRPFVVRLRLIMIHR
jgi:hypothetical protein